MNGKFTTIIKTTQKLKRSKCDFHYILIYLRNQLFNWALPSEISHSNESRWAIPSHHVTKSAASSWNITILCLEEKTEIEVFSRSIFDRPCFKSTVIPKVRLKCGAMSTNATCRSPDSDRIKQNKQKYRKSFVHASGHGFFFSELNWISIISILVSSVSQAKSLFQ